MKKICSFFILAAFFSVLPAKNNYRKNVTPTKNVILMIPDGCSLSVYSAARWYKAYKDKNLDANLAVDPYICGTVKTFNSTSIIGDSAPTTSAYMTGYLMQAGNVSIYPEKSKVVENLIEVDTLKSHQPLTTVMEAAKLDQGKSIGLVVTCGFNHATPADCTAHHYNRSNYSGIAEQQVANKIDVVMGGGNKFLTPALEDRLQELNTKVIRNDLEAFNNYNGNESVWALFSDEGMPYDIDRDADAMPSIAEMTEKAIQRLSKNENGFFLMVEGSQVDWAAHSNDVNTMITEYLAFDKAVQVAIDFAQENGNTTVVILSDHGNSGLSIGRRDLADYGRTGLEKMYGNIANINASVDKIEALLKKAKPEEYRGIMEDKTGIKITDEEYQKIADSTNKTESDYTKKSESVNLNSVIKDIINKRHYFGFTTGGHTGEEVLLAAYHPKGEVPSGFNTNLEINAYLQDVLGLERSLDEITEEIFAPHDDVFKGMKYSIDKKDKKRPTLVVTHKKNKLEIPANSSKVKLNNKDIEIKTPVVYIDKNDTFYLPKNLKDLVAKKQK